MKICVLYLARIALPSPTQPSYITVDVSGLPNMEENEMTWTEPAVDYAEISIV